MSRIGLWRICSLEAGLTYRCCLVAPRVLDVMHYALATRRYPLSNCSASSLDLVPRAREVKLEAASGEARRDLGIVVLPTLVTQGPAKPWRSGEGLVLALL